MKTPVPETIHVDPAPIERKNLESKLWRAKVDGKTYYADNNSKSIYLDRTSDRTNIDSDLALQSLPYTPEMKAVLKATAEAAREAAKKASVQPAALSPASTIPATDIEDVQGFADIPGHSSNKFEAGAETS